MKFNILAGYLLAFAIVGFFLWIIRGFVRGLRKQHQLPGELPDTLRGPAESRATEDPEKIPVHWPLNLFFLNDDLDYPGELEILTSAGGFLRCSAPLRVGQMVSLYIDVPGGERCRATAKVLWVGQGRGQHPAAQVRFEGLAATEKARLQKAAAAVLSAEC